MAASPSSVTTPAPLRWSAALVGLAALAIVAVGLAVFHYFTGLDYTLPLEAVTQLKPLPTTLDSVRVGVAALPVQANVYLLTQTHNAVGPFVRPEAAAALLLVLAVALAYFLATITALERIPFVIGMALVIFLLMSLNADSLGVFSSQQQYFLILLLLALGLPAYAFHAFWPAVPLWQRLLAFLLLVGGLSSLLLLRSTLSYEETVLHLASYATMGGAVAVALLVVWVAFENIYGLLWLNTQAETPRGRFGLLPFVLASGLYLGLLFLYYWNDGDVQLLPTVRLDPLVLLLPAVLIGWLGLRRRAATYHEWLPYAPSAAYLYLALTAVAAAALGYALATVNNPLLDAARQFTALAFLTCGAAFLLYVLFNFAPLIRRRLRVYLVAYEPRRLPFYSVYLLGIGALIAVVTRNNFFVLDQVRAGYYNELGDLTRLQSEAQPTVDALALLAERYYAESDLLDRFNHKASLGRAALYHFRLQRQNELNALNRALSRAPYARISLRLAALYNEPTDFFDRLQALRAGLRQFPNNASLANDMAQLYMRSTLADSVDYYLTRAETLAPSNAVVQTNRLAFLLQLQDWSTAQQWAAAHPATAQAPALQSNELLLARLANQPTPAVAPPTSATDLSLPTFARFYHLALARATTGDTSLLPTLQQLSQQPANSAYQEQLTFLRALTQYNAGRFVAARATLQPLVIGTDASTAYYLYLLGSWQLQQQLYSAAAASFASAVQNGYAPAQVGQAYALALNNQPDSARTLAATVDSATLPYPTHLLRQAVGLTYPASYLTAPDSVKAQFLVLRGGSLPADQLLPATAAIQAPAVRQVAVLAQAPRAINAQQLAAVRAAIDQFAPATTQKTAASSAWNVVRGNMYVAENRWSDLSRLLQKAYFTPAEHAKRLTLSALWAAHAQPTSANQRFATLLREAPFDEQGVLAAANFYTRQQQYDAAYNALLKGLEYNPASINLLKAYVLATVHVGLTQYAEAPLDQLRTLLSPAEYRTFHSQYEAQRAALTAEAASWD